MDDRMADSYMMADIEGIGFSNGVECGKQETLQRVKDALFKYCPGAHLEHQDNCKCIFCCLMKGLGLEK